MRAGPARSVRIAVPAYAGICDDTKDSIIRGALALHAAGIGIETIDIHPGCCYIDLARNILVAKFLASTATDLVFIDSDVGFEPQELVRLCSAPQPFVAGIYPKKEEPPAFPVALSEEVVRSVNGLVIVSMAPTGFMRIGREVFETIDVPTFDHEGKQIAAYFACVIRDGRYFGEDVEFCRRAAEVGYPPRAFAEMDLRHIGKDKDGNPVTYSNNWGIWLRSQMREAA